MREGHGDPTTGTEELDPYGTAIRPSIRSIARFIGRGITLLVGLAIGWFGVAFYVLRCFSTCPSDPAENVISQILALSLVGFGLIVIVGAMALGTRWASAGLWLIIGFGTLIALGGAASLALVPALQVVANRTDTAIFAIIDTAAGVGCILLAILVRRRGRT